MNTGSEYVCRLFVFELGKEELEWNKRLAQPTQPRPQEATKPRGVDVVLELISL